MIDRDDDENNHNCSGGLRNNDKGNAADDARKDVLPANNAE
jgi:hypothetical protein